VEHADDGWLDLVASEAPDAETHYDQRESVTIAFLVALEALGPRQRAVLLLRDVVGHSPAEAAAVLGTTEGNVRVLHLRARRTMATYDRARCIPSATLRDRHRVALDRFLGCLATGDVDGIEKLLTEAVRTTTDAAGAYGALRAPLDGRSAVARFYARAARNRAPGGPSVRIALVNGLPAAIVDLARPVRRQAPRLVLALQLDDDGLVAAVHTVLAPGKLSAIARNAEA
jgi:RNA polymerase sigma-70 factor (ECF subfamily)